MPAYTLAQKLDIARRRLLKAFIAGHDVTEMIEWDFLTSNSTAQERADFIAKAREKAAYPHAQKILAYMGGSAPAALVTELNAITDYTDAQMGTELPVFG